MPTGKRVCGFLETTTRGHLCGSTDTAIRLGMGESQESRLRVSVERGQAGVMMPTSARVAMPTSAPRC